VTGSDLDDARANRAAELGVVDVVGTDASAEIAFVATPASAVVPAVRELVAASEFDGLVVTDVAGVKGPIVAELSYPRFVAGHPMAGSEQEGPDGADPELFVGATWVLTPTDDTDPSAFTALQSVIASLGADVVALAPDRHDELVAVISHVPHLTSATLMSLAGESPVDHAALMRLAAGGFRDMTRIAAGSPAIWPDICRDNAGAIVPVLDRLIVQLTEVRRIVADGDRQALSSLLERARNARQNLPPRGVRPAAVAELRVVVPDRPGVLAEVTTLAGELGVNIYDLEIAHSAEGPRGVLVLVVDASLAEAVVTPLRARGFRVSWTTAS
jgi:prephenate dehydrogenase